MIKAPMILDRYGKPVSPANKLRNNAPGKQANGLYGNIYSYPNYGRYRPRFYSLQDTAQGLDTLSRELLVRWSREMVAQLPFIKSAIRVLADFSIGDSYTPQYLGSNKEWWNYAEEWLLTSWYPNCNVRGSTYDFQTSLKLESTFLDIDGDYLLVYGKENGQAKFQIIPSHRIRTQSNSDYVTEGPLKGCVVDDGVYYTPQGKAVAYQVENASNLVTSFGTNGKDMIFYARDATLMRDPTFIDKARGVPSIGEAILQALSVQELDQYLMEKSKIESTVALIEKTPTGEAPYELQQTLAALEEQGSNLGAFNPSPNVHAVDIVQGSQIRYIHAEGGDLKSLAGTGPADQTQEYMARLETQILSTIGVPHQLIYSTDRLSGRATSGVAEVFRSAIQRRQKVLDKSAKFRIAWALSVAMENGDIPRNDTELLYNVIALSHPEEFSLDRKYDNAITLNSLNAGISTLNDTTTKLFNRTAEDTLEIQKQEQIAFYKKAKQVSDETGVDMATVIQGWRNQAKPQPTPETQDLE